MTTMHPHRSPQHLKRSWDQRIERGMDQQDTFHLRSEQLEITLLSRGAALVGVRFAGSRQNMVLGFADPEDHFRIPAFAGPLVGPIANRVAQGRLNIGGIPHQMQCNENGETALHSGDLGIHAHVWRVASHSRDAITFETQLLDGEGGLPGNRLMTARYSLKDTALTLEITAATDAETVMNIASHAYWNLDEQADVSGHHLQIVADYYLPVDHQMLPTGEVRPTAGTPFDYSTPRLVPLSAELDVNFCLNTAPNRAITHAATLTGASGVELRIATTAPGIQAYNGAFLPDEPIPMADCTPIAPYSAIALETQGWPDAPNQPGFPSISLSPAAPYTQTTVFTLSRPQ